MCLCGTCVTVGVCVCVVRALMAWWDRAPALHHALHVPGEQSDWGRTRLDPTRDHGELQSRAAVELSRVRKDT